MYQALVYEENPNIFTDKKPVMSLWLGFSPDICFWDVANKTFHSNISSLLICYIDNRPHGSSAETTVLDNNTKVIISSNDYSKVETGKVYYFENNRKQYCYAVVIKI